jgi:death-on-curing protein
VLIGSGIAEGQHFPEGNKRTALVALRTFLSINGYNVDVSQEERSNWIISLSLGTTIDQLAERVRNALMAEPPASEEP